MTSREINEEISALRAALNIKDKKELSSMFSRWAFQTEEQEEQAYRLDRLERLAA